MYMFRLWLERNNRGTLKLKYKGEKMNLIRSLTPYEAQDMVPDEIWNIYGYGIITGRIIPYLGFGKVHFRETN